MRPGAGEPCGGCSEAPRQVGDARPRGPRLRGLQAEREQPLHDGRARLDGDERGDRVDHLVRGQLALREHVPRRRDDQRAGQRVGQLADPRAQRRERRRIGADRRVGEVAGVHEVERAARQLDRRLGAGHLHLDVAPRDEPVGGRVVAGDAEAVRARRAAVGRGRAQHRPVERQGVGARPVEPVRGPSRQVAAGGGGERRHEVVEHRVAPGVGGEVGPQPFHERVLADVRGELVQHRLALVVGDGVEVRHRLLDVRHVAADGVGGRAHVLAVADDLRVEQLRRPGVRELRGARERPGGGPGGERLVQPQVVPPAHRHEVAEPHVGHLVQHHVRAHGPLAVARGAAMQEVVRVGDAAPVLHRAAHVGHERLVVALLRERVGEALPEPGEPAGGEVEQLIGVALEHGPQRAAAVEPEVVAADGAAHLVERSRVHDGDVGGERRGRREGPAARGALRLRDRVRRAVARDGPRLGREHGEAVHRLEVGLVEARPEPAGLVGLERHPDVDEPVRGVDRAEDALPVAGVRLRGGDDEHVALAQVGEGEAPVGEGAEVELHSVQRRRADVRDDVDEGGGPGAGAGEGAGRDGADGVALEQAGQVDVDVVLLDGEQRGPFGRLLAGQAGDGHAVSSRRCDARRGAPSRRQASPHARRAPGRWRVRGGARGPPRSGAPLP